MNKIKDFFKTKALGWWFSLAACVLALITLITYTARGGNYLSPVSNAAVACLSIGFVVNVLILIKDFKVGAFVPLLLYTGTLAILLNSEMTFISNVMFGVDGNSFDGAFWVFVIGIFATVIAAAVAAIKKMTKDK